MLHICQGLACWSFLAGGCKAAVATVAKATSEFFVADHGHDSHESVVLGTALISHSGTIMSSLLVTPPSGIAGYRHDLSGLWIDHDGAGPTANTILLGLLCSCASNREEVCGSRSIELGLNASELIERGSILQQLCCWIVLSWPIPFRPHGGLFSAHWGIAWDDCIEAPRQAFDFDVRSKNLADLEPWEQGRAWYEQEDSLKAIAVVVSSPGKIDGQVSQSADSTKMGK